MTKTPSKSMSRPVPEIPKHKTLTKTQAKNVQIPLGNHGKKMVGPVYGPTHQRKTQVHGPNL